MSTAPATLEQAILRISVLERRIEREIGARSEAEDRLEKKSVELFAANQALREVNSNLEQRVADRTKELLHARDEALLANKTKSDFLANMSHELRTPLNAIIGFSEIMAGELLGPIGTPKYIEYSGDILKSGKHLLEVINDMLDLAKVEAGRMQLYEEACDVAKIVTESTQLLSDRAVRAGLSITFDLPAGLPKVKADERKIRQIVFNFLSNAIKFTPRGGDIRIGAGLTATGAMSFWVQDTGIGIPQDKIETIFEAFVQIENIMTRTHDGSGLGLPLCRALAELHGGSVALRSVLGKGTIVSATLPAARVIDPLLG